MDGPDRPPGAANPGGGARAGKWGPRAPVGLGRRRVVAGGRRILSPGQHVGRIYLVEDGEIALERPVLGQEPLVVGLVGRGGVVGDGAAFAGEPSLCRARATTRTALLEVRRDRLGALLSRDPRLFRWWLRALACRIVEEQRAVLRLMLKDLTAQVASLLHDYLGHRRSGVVEMSQQKIARILGAQRQSVSRVLGQLRDRGVLATSYRAVRIIDGEALRATAGPDPGPRPCGPEPRLSGG